MILRRASLVTFAVAMLLQAQKTSNPINVDGKVLRNAGNMSGDSLPGSWLSYGRNQSETRFQRA